MLIPIKNNDTVATDYKQIMYNDVKTNANYCTNEVKVLLIYRSKLDYHDTHTSYFDIAFSLTTANILKCSLALLALTSMPKWHR